jgi:hypothetical protein
MRIYISAMEMVKEVERDLFEMGTRYQTETVQDKNVAHDPDYKTIELFGYGYLLKRWRDLKEMTQYLKLDEKWLEAESDERLGIVPCVHPNPGDAWKLLPDLWLPFLRNGFFAYSYAERWGKQLPYVINELKEHPFSRQAIITMYDQHQDMMNWGGLDRVPCSLTYQFVYREEKLNLLYSQRSCDFKTFFGADVYFACKLLEYVATRLGQDPGSLVHVLGSLHAFQKDLEGVF